MRDWPASPFRGKSRQTDVALSTLSFLTLKNQKSVKTGSSARRALDLNGTQKPFRGDRSEGKQ